MLTRLFYTVFLGLLALLSVAKLNAQSTNKSFEVGYSDTLKLDSNSIIKESFQLFTSNGNAVDSSAYILDYVNGDLIWKNNSYKGQTLKASFKTFPFNFSKPYYHKDPATISNNISLINNPFRYRAVPRNEASIFELGGIEKSGSISRGIGFGNTRDMSVSSSMNLQLNGKIAENLYVMAAITDENIPIQPEGNTQQLQDFDQVYIKVYNDKSELVAGDYVLKSKESYFMRYFKKAQGLTGETKFYVGNKLDTTKAGKMHVKLSGALSRGKFTRNIIQGVEGNQGPYRLRGEENEPYIIILSGTERVYIDGKLQTRGQDHDYVINYNTAEITFTARQLVTKDKRIVVEFQYADQNYTRSLVQFSDFYEYKKLKLNFNLYSEQDAKNQSLQQDLSEEQKNTLRLVGDSVDKAFSSGAKPVEFTDNEVLYKIVDTLGYDSVYVYSVNPDSAKYRVTFSEVGAGKGNYVLKSSVANGRVYQWVEPIAGVRQGTHEPIILLYAPKQKQMVSLSGQYAFNKNSTIDFEGAVSNNDANTFSDKHQDDNIGLAGKFGWKHEFKLSPKTSVQPIVKFEHWSKHFSEIERVRTVEFYRDWNLRGVELKEDQNIVNAGVILKQSQSTKLQYIWKGFYAGGSYNATNHLINADIKHKGLTVDFNGSYMNSKGSISKTEFLRHKSLIQQKLFVFNIGYRDDHENNQITEAIGDTLAANSYQFWEREFFIKSLDSANVEYKVFYNQRNDRKAWQKELAPLTFGESVGASLAWKKNRFIKLGNKTTYRKLTIENQQNTQLKPDENLLSRFEYSLRLFKGSITASSFYEIGSGLEAGRDFQYVEVPAGQGEYTWIDYNDNGVKELNEFEIAAYDDEKKYIKISVLTDNYVKVYSHQFNQSLLLNPFRVWRKKKGLLKFMSRFSDQFAYRIQRKTQSNSEDARFNPLPSAGIDSQLVSLNSSLRNTLYFNRTDRLFGADWTYQDIKARTFLTAGFENRVNTFHNFRARLNINRLFLFEAESKVGEKYSEADYASTRNYRINYNSIQPKLTYQKGVGFRMALRYKYEIKRNAADLGGELGESNTLGLETKLSKVGKGSFLIELNFINLTYNGESNNSLAYEMLEGLLPGNNGTWQVSYQRNIGKYLQMDLSYNGRQSEDTKTVHAGSMRVRAFF